MIPTVLVARSRGSQNAVDTVRLWFRPDGALLFRKFIFHVEEIIRLRIEVEIRSDLLRADTLFSPGRKAHRMESKEISYNLKSGFFLLFLLI